MRLEERRYEEKKLRIQPGISQYQGFQGHLSDQLRMTIVNRIRRRSPEFADRLIEELLPKSEKLRDSDIEQNLIRAKLKRVEPKRKRKLASKQESSDGKTLIETKSAVIVKKSDGSVVIRSKIIYDGSLL